MHIDTYSNLNIRFLRKRRSDSLVYITRFLIIAFDIIDSTLIIERLKSKRNLQNNIGSNFQKKLKKM